MRTTLGLLLIFLSASGTNCEKSVHDTGYAAPPAAIPMLKPVSVNMLNAKVPETSGLIYFDNSFWTINDSGNENILYRIDAKTGSVNAEIKIKNSANTDWEELTQDQEYIYVADIGDNNLKRAEKQIYRVSKAELLRINGDGEADSEVIRFSYPAVDGKVVNFNAEALIAYKGELHLFTKDLFETNHFTLSPQPGTSTAKFVEKYKTDGMVTGAAVNVSDKKLILVGYMGFGERLLWEFKVADDNHFFNLPARSFTMGGVSETGQVESVCFNAENKLYLTNERFGAVSQQLWNVSYPFK